MRLGNLNLFTLMLGSPCLMLYFFSMDENDSSFGYILIYVAVALLYLFIFFSGKPDFLFAKAQHFCVPKAAIEYTALMFSLFNFGCFFSAVFTSAYAFSMILFFGLGLTASFYAFFVTLYSKEIEFNG
jgi:hypothetical protein